MYPTMKIMKISRLLIILALVFFSYSINAMVFGQEGGRPSLAIVSPHLDNDPYTFLKAAEPWQSTMKISLFGLNSDGALPIATVDSLRRYKLVIFEALGARVALLKPQIDSLLKVTKVLFLGTPLARGNVDLRDYPDLETYWSNGNLKNYKGMLSYLAGTYFKLPVPVQSPVVYADNGFYYPGVDSVFTDAASYLKWYRLTYPEKIKKDQPRVGVVFYQSYFVKRDLAFIDSLIRSIEAEGAIAIPYMSRSGFRIDSVFRVRKRPVVDVLLYGGMFLNFKDPAAGIRDARKLNVPLLGFYADYYRNREQWEKNENGSSGLTDRFYFTEKDGVFEPMTIATEELDRHNIRRTMPIDYQIKWRVRRALRWAALRKLTNKDKKVIITYYSEGNNQADAGADIDAYLDVPASLEKLLYVLKDSGYATGTDISFFRDTIAGALSIHGSNVPPNDTASLRKKFTSGKVVKIPVQEYLGWFHTLSAKKQKQVIDQWGPVPGNIMTLKDQNGKQYFVFPITSYGNITLAPHPNWGVEDNLKAIYQTKALVPSHAYLAFYFWMQKTLKPDAFLSLFSQLSLMPGREEGPSRKDWNGILLEDIPHISLVPLIAGGGRGDKRKTSALTIDYLTEIMSAGLSDNLQLLQTDINTWKITTDPSLKSILSDSISGLIRAEGVDVDLGYDLNKRNALTEEQILAVEKYLRRISKQTTAHGSHILGQGPDSSTMGEMITEMIGKKELPFFKNNKLQVEKTADLVKSWLSGLGVSSNHPPVNKSDSSLYPYYEKFLTYKGLLNQTSNEITQLLRALDGYYIPPGPGSDPVRDPEALPSGRNPYTSNNKMIPSRAAWVLGKQMAEQLLARFKEKHGQSAFPRKVGFVLWSSDITQTQGVTEAEILYLIGVRPVWNNRGQVMDMELMDHKELGRPRIDVLITTSGTYRDHFRSNMEFLDKAIGLVAGLQEPDNFVALNSRRYQKSLQLDSLRQASFRIFSSDLGSYSTNLEFAGKSQDRPDSALADFYFQRMGYAYGSQVNALKMSRLFQENVNDLEAAAFNRSSSVYGMMDHPMVAAYFGAYNLAAHKTNGQKIDMFINSLQPNNPPTVITLEQAFRTELRSRYFSSKWIRAMMGHGYDGARYMNEFSGTLFLWNITNPQMVHQSDWLNLYNTYIDDNQHLGLKDYFGKYNPAARKQMAKQLLQAGSKGFWTPDAGQQAVLSRFASGENYLESQSRQGGKLPEGTGNVKIKGIKGGSVKGLGRQPDGRSVGGRPASPVGEKIKSSHSAVTGQQITEEHVRLPGSSQKVHVRKGEIIQLTSILVLLLGIFLLGWKRGGKNQYLSAED